MQQQLRIRSVQTEPSFDGLEGIDLRYRDTPITTQIGARCSAYGLTASIENLLGSPLVDKLSESHLWSQYQVYSSVSAVEAAKRMSITEYDMWPRELKSPRPGWKEKAHTSLENITLLDDDVMSTIKALDEGRPVYLAFSVTKSLETCLPVLDPNSPDTGGGHAIGISGYGVDKRIKGGGYFIIKNSWGTDCGDKGYQYLPFNYCLRKGSSYCLMWDIQGVKTAFPGVPSILPAVPVFDLSKIKVHSSSSKSWYSRYRTVTVKIEGDSLHARQIKDVSYSVDNHEYGVPVPIDVDTVTFSFATTLTAHNIALKIRLNNGSVFESIQRWSL